MKTIIINIAAVVVGLLIGGMVNMGIIMAGSAIVPLPAGVDPNDMESLRAAMPLFEAKDFAIPFLAHALGALVGALVAALIAASHRMKIGNLFAGRYPA
ncbi:MAG: hypothetical protein LC730_03795 [Acidobacteria bacterium]|nr:hypothetical protein [Acidobacteriota bacterium]